MSKSQRPSSQKNIGFEHSPEFCELCTLILSKEPKDIASTILIQWVDYE